MPASLQQVPDPILISMTLAWLASVTEQPVFWRPAESTSAMRINKPGAVYDI